MDLGSFETSGNKSDTFKDILINATNDEVIIPISATYDKAVLHIGIGNRTGVSIEKPEMKQGRKIKTSVEYATREFMGRHFDVEKRESPKRKKMHQRSEGKRKNVQESAKVKSTETNASKAVFNVKVDPRVENACKKELSNQMCCADIISATPRFTNIPEFAGEKLSKKENFVQSLPGDMSGYTDHIMELSTKLSEAALQGAVSEMEPFCSTKPLDGGQMYITKLSNTANKRDQKARKLSEEALREALSEMEPLCTTKPLDGGRLYITKLSNTANRRDQKARKLSEEALREALSEMEPLCTTKPMDGGKMYITKLSNTTNKRGQNARKLSEEALREALSEMEPLCTTKPMDGGQMYITKLSNTTNKRGEIARKISEAALREALSEMEPLCTTKPMDGGKMYITKLSNAANKHGEIARKLSGEAVRDAVSEMLPLLSTKPLSGGHMYITKLSNAANKHGEIARKLSEEAVRDAVSEMLPLLSTKPLNGGQMYIIKLSNAANKHGQIAMKLSEEALREALSEMLPLCTTKPLEGWQMYITKLSNTANKPWKIARKLSEQAVRNAVSERLPLWSTKPIGAGRMYTTKLSTNKRKEMAKNVSDTVVGKTISEIAPALSTMPHDTMQLPWFKDVVLRTRNLDQYRSEDGTDGLLEVGKILSEAAIRDAISEIAPQFTTRPPDQDVFTDDKRCTTLLMKTSRDLTETALRNAISEMMPLYNTKPHERAQMYITKRVNAVQRISITGGARESEDYKKMEKEINVKRRGIRMGIVDKQDVENTVSISDKGAKEIELADTAVIEKIESELPKKDLFTGPGHLLNIAHISDKMIRSSDNTPQTELEMARATALEKVPCVSEELSSGKPDLKTSDAVANVPDAFVDMSGKVVTSYEPDNQHNLAVHYDTTLIENITRPSEIANPDCTVQDPNTDEAHAIENSSSSPVLDSAEESMSTHTIAAPENLVPTTVSLSDTVTSLIDGPDGSNQESDAFGIMSIFLNSDIHCAVDKAFLYTLRIPRSNLYPELSFPRHSHGNDNSV